MANEGNAAALTSHLKLPEAGKALEQDVAGLERTGYIHEQLDPHYRARLAALTARPSSPTIPHGDTRHA